VIKGQPHTQRSLTFESIFFGMNSILPTQKDAAENLGRLILRTSTYSTADPHLTGASRSSRQICEEPLW